ncbi:MAG: pyruvate synthase [Elusimicrobia bacterium]|nr:pyruvate synthase [Elusimicrobiota bacterium]
MPREAFKLSQSPATEPAAKQVVDFRSGNEMAALAAKQINFHVMGYYPITPSTEVAENLDAMWVEGAHGIRMIPADGEHSAAGICYGASTGGGRVLNVTSSQGLLYSLEQLPVQSGTRFPMVLNVATRSVSGPLDIRGDHSDIYYALNAGWIVLLASDPQSVYDMNFIAVRIGEHPKVRLPVLVAYDGFFTSHQKRRVRLFDDPAAVRNFVGEPHFPYHALDPKRPLTIGPYMNDPDLINNKFQLHLAFEQARFALAAIFEEYGALSGRRYDLLEWYRMEDAEAALVLLNSAAETAKDVVDEMRSRGIKVGLLSPRVLRPFPHEGFRRALKNVRAVLIADRADSYGSGGGNLAHEVKSALKDDPDNRSVCLSRIYGLGGRDFYKEDAEAFFTEALEAAAKGKAIIPFAYHGVTSGTPGKVPAQVLPPLVEGDFPGGMAKVEQDEATGRLRVELRPFWKMTEVPSRIAPGHGACPGCGVFPALHQFFRVIEGNVVVLFQTGCAMVVTTGYPFSAHRITYLHNLFQNGAATLSGLVEMYHERVRRGELAGTENFTFVMVSGDGGMDIGMGSAIGAANRNHRMILIEYDNQGYMNTGAQLSYATPMGHKTSTSNVGPKAAGKMFHHKDTAQIFAATHIPYVFTAVEGYPEDLMKKAAKAQWYARREGMAYGKILSYCPLNWRSPDDLGASVLQAAVDSCFFPLYEVEKGKTVITYNPEMVDRRIPAAEFLAKMGKTRHLTQASAAEVLSAFEAEVDRRWKRLKAMHESPVL